MAGFLAGLIPNTGVIRRPFGSLGVSVRAMARRLTSAYVRLVQGLKIRVSAVRFCPWPLRSNHNSRAEIGPVTGSVAARVRLGGWRGIWRDFDQDSTYLVARAGLAYCAANLVVFVLALVALWFGGAR